MAPVLTEFTFTGMTHEGSKVRVYAISGVPEGKEHLPGILHIHGGGQTVNPQWLRFWNDRGYAALTFNWGGAWPNRDKFTDWGKLTQGNHRDAGAMAMATEPSVRASSWYLWTRISRRALTCLETMEGVDPDRLGIFGVSMGGTIVWPFAAMDRRVKAACAIYGVGWNTYPDEVGSPDPKAGDTATKLWRNTMESESYARLVKCPMLLPGRHQRPARQHGPVVPDAHSGADRGALGVHTPLPSPHRRRARSRPAALDGRLTQGREAVPEVTRRRGSTGGGWCSPSCCEA